MDLRSRFPDHGYIGLALIAFGWALAWLRPESWQWLWENGFLFLWGGYCILIDALNVRYSGTSLLSRNGKAYIGLFILSVPLWWIFEFFNLSLRNWHYLQVRPLGHVEYAIRASVHFSVVIPAVLSTAELWGATPLPADMRNGRRIAVTKRRLATLILTAVVMMILVVSFPKICFPLLWIGLYLFCDSLNVLIGAPSLLKRLERGDYRPVFCLAAGALTCGFFWEMWNFYALPKWYYTLPYFNDYHIFEMPALGYLGYPPFGLEVYAIYHLMIGLCGLKKTGFYGGEHYIRL
jgi:hypothetical protein